MATNPTITIAPLINSATHRAVYVTVSAGAATTQLTNSIIYDPTTTPWTNSGAYVGTKIRVVSVTSSVQSGTSLPQISLDWDASTPVTAVSIPCNSHFCVDTIKHFAPLPNQGGTGVTGKIGLTTLGLVAGDTITILLEIING
jgi:hypothetical protein